MTPAPRNPRYESLDAWRGVACLSVVLFHSVIGYIATPETEARLRAEGGSAADWLVLAISRLWVGVPLFFVISGYCIAAAADSARRRARSGRTFFYRRFRRIYPPLWAYLALAALAIAALPPGALPGPTAGYPHPIPYPRDVPLGQWLGSVTLTEEWRHYLGGPPHGYFNGQLWTLCYEEQFYLVVGLLLTLSRRALFPAVGLVTALVFLNVANLNALLGDRIGVNLNAYQRPLPGFFFDGLWLVFAAGVGMYYRVNYATPILRRCVDGLLLAGLVWAASFVPTAWDFKPTLPGYLAVGFLFALVLAALHGCDRRVAGCAAVAPLAWCGRMCYSLYLVHAPVVALVQWNLYRAGVTTSAGALLVTVPAGVAASLALGQLFNRLVEARFLNAGPSREPQPQPLQAPHRLGRQGVLRRLVLRLVRHREA
jgi:peptidoglycan/LPS O-acetylase OafA/YrhL